MFFEPIRTWDGSEMNHLIYSWESEGSMGSPGCSDINNNLIYENDILKYKKYISILKRGQFNYNGKILNGWYLECYYKDNKVISPFYQNDSYEVIGNIFKNKDLYNKIKLREEVRIDDFVG